MNLANRVFDFAKTEAEKDDDTGILYGLNLLSNQYEKNFADRNLKVFDVQQSEPMPLPDGSVKEFNAYIPFQVIVKAISQKLEDLHAARETANAIALEYTKRIYADGSLNGAGCTTRILKKKDNWKDLGNQKVAESVLLLLLNERK